MPSANDLDRVGLTDFMKIGLPSIGMMCIELWSFEIMALLAAALSVEEVAV